MMADSHSDIETTLFIQDCEYKCTFSFDHQHAEPEGFTDPGCSDEFTITGAVIEPSAGLIVDLFAKEYSWLMVSELNDSLEDDARAHVQSITGLTK